MLTVTIILDAESAGLVRGAQRRADGSATVVRRLPGPTTLLDAVEALGVPRCEVGKLCDGDGNTRGAGDHTRDGDVIAVSGPGPRPHLGERFLCDAHLGKLARRLRQLGFDTLWRRDWHPGTVARLCRNEGFIVLSGSRNLLKRKGMERAMLVRTGTPEAQAAAVLARFDLTGAVRPFSRCGACNGLLEPVDRERVAGRIPPRTARWRDEYHLCADCERLYWSGTHTEALQSRFAAVDLVPAAPVVVRHSAEPASVDLHRLLPRLPADRPRFLLESALEQSARGRWSHLGGGPAALLTGRRGRSRADGMHLTLTTWRRPDGAACDPPRIESWRGDPFAALRRLQDEYRPPQSGRGDAGAPPFGAGLVGFFGYETAHAIEDLPDTGRDHGLPDLAFMVADETVARDHADGDRLHVSVVGRGRDAAAAARDADERLAAWRSLIAEAAGPPDSDPLPAAEPQPRGGLSDVRAPFDADAYAAVVARCREHILAGDVFEVCPTQRLEMDLHADPWRLYRILCAVNPAPFAAYLDFGTFQVLSASPERFLRVGPDRRVESRPIKGTRPRAADPAADEALRRELATAGKDRAENVMIVDLLRNDLGRVCEIGTIAVPELCAVETFATVHQLVSAITGRLRADRDVLDLVRACFPGGSMTGAPKIAAMKIIDAVEPDARGVYSGAIGYLSHSGAADLSIVIRTLVCAAGTVSFGVGGAVTADSEPAAEYRETLDKARALVAAVRLANDEAR